MYSQRIIAFSSYFNPTYKETDMNILAFGPNGSGKGTQGAIVKEKYGMDHIESGAIFREHIKGGTELGKKAKEFIDRGDLVPDEITIPMVLETLEKSKEKQLISYCLTQDTTLQTI